MKRSPALRALSSQHHAGLVLARRICRATTSKEVADAWNQVVQRFTDELEPHFRQEEEHLLPALAEAGETDLVRRTLDEHSRLRSLLSGGVRDAETLQQFARLLDAHIRFEERDLFECAQQKLPAFSVGSEP